ncbi:MAG: preprotein translocase subunit SecY [Candidatus Spechtbacterales bacterium]
MKWTDELLAIFKVKDLRKKILFVLFILGIFRLVANIPVPGIDRGQLESFLSGNEFFGILNIFSGGALSNLSIAMLGLGPYITSTIILQIFTLIFPKLKEMYQESGEQGRQKFNQYGRLLTVPFAMLQGYALMVLFTRQGILMIEGPVQTAAVLTSMVGGAILLMWLGELVSERGIGNGISLLIFAGIISAVPLALRDVFVNATRGDFPQYLLFAAVSLIIIAAVVVVTEARRNIPISYAKRVRGNRVYGGASTFLPLTLNPAGVIPIIFALSLVLFPGIIAQFLFGSANPAVQSIAGFLNSFTPQDNLALYSIAYFALVVIFTYFYTAVTFNPQTVAQNLQRQGGFVPGIRPGPPTADRIAFILNRTLLIGALFLGFIAVVPAIAQGVGGGIEGISFLIGGTSVLIVVSVALETTRQVRAQIIMRQYD